ncbi:MAG: acylneuraminate cytidylyltransferase [Bacteroidia bacterium]|nr:acylneuraminate cytidylyltransferase [Bacteroidia bacterium]
MSNNPGIILQARMGSSRLPGKSMMQIGGTNLPGYILRRFKNAGSSLLIVLATTSNESDDVLAEWAIAEGIPVFRGNEQNVLDRYVTCARQFGFDPVIRLTGDNPFVDIPELNRLMQMFNEQNCDYISSHGLLPLGSGAEVFSLRALTQSLQKADRPDHFEHVNEYILQHPGEFRIGLFAMDPEKNFPDVRLTVDTMKDLKNVQSLVKHDTDPGGSILPLLKICLGSA